MGLQPGGENGTWFQTVPIFIARMDTTRTLDVDGHVARARQRTCFPSTRQNGGRNLPIGTGTRSFDGARVIYGGQLGSGALVSPAAAAGKLVVFTVPVRPRPAGATGASTPSVRSRSTPTPPASPPSCSTWCRASRRAACTGRRCACAPRRPLDGAAPLSLLVTPDAAQRAARRRVARRAHRRRRKVAPSAARRVRRRAGALSRRGTSSASCRAAIPRCAASTSPSARTTITSACTARPLDHDSVLRVQQVVRRQGAQDTRARADRRRERRASPRCATASRARTAARAATR